VTVTSKGSDYGRITEAVGILVMFMVIDELP
jgi:hypothetical protein